MSAQVPVLSIVGMAVTVLISIGLPVAAMIVSRKKLHGQFLPVLIGAGVFIVFALVLEQLFHSGIGRLFGSKLRQNIWVYAAYGGIAAALFEETGRFLAMRFLMKRWRTKENALMYGVGHGGMESILLVGITNLSNIVIAAIINSGTFDYIFARVDPAVRDQFSGIMPAFTSTPSAEFFLAGAERVAAFCLQLCLSYIVYRAVKDRKWILLFLAAFLHFLVDAGIVVLANQIPLALTEAVLVLAVAVIAVFVILAYRKEKKTEAETETETEAETEAERNA